MVRPSFSISCPADSRLRGHLRPLLHFTFNLCTVHPSLQITLLVDPVMSPRIVQELAEHPHPPSVLDRIQIIEIVEVNNTDIVDDLKASGKETMPIYLKALFQGGGPEIETKFGPPTLAVFDVSLTR